MKKRKPSRTSRQMKSLTKRVLEYYFNNPHANGYGIMVEKFKASETTLRKILSEEFDRRFKKAQETRDKFK